MQWPRIHLQLHCLGNKAYYDILIKAIIPSGGLNFNSNETTEHSVAINFKYLQVHSFVYSLLSLGSSFVLENLVSVKDTNFEKYALCFLPNKTEKKTGKG